MWGSQSKKIALPTKPSLSQPAKLHVGKAEGNTKLREKNKKCIITLERNIKSNQNKY